MNILFAGTPAFAAQHLKQLAERGVSFCAVITQPDKPGKRGKKPVPSEVKRVAEQLHLPVLQPAKLTAADITAFAPDLLIVVAYGQILRPDLLALPTHGCINVHASILPRWRGAAPIQRAIEAGDAETGVCIMQMDAGLDTGDVLRQVTCPISPTDTSLTLMEKLSELGVDGLVQTLNDIEQGKLQPLPQPEEGTYAKKILKQEAQIDWHTDALSIVRKIHAFNPDPVCFSHLNDLRVKFYQAQFVEADNQAPGEILEVSKRGVLVAAKDGAVLLQRLQLPIGKGAILTGSDILNARTDILFPGAIFS